MKEEAKKVLIKDVATAALVYAIVLVVMVAIVKTIDFGLVIAPLAFAGIPFGWRWLSNIITAIGIWGLLIKFFGALVLGWLALPIVIVKDIIAYTKA